MLATRVDGPAAARRIATHLADALGTPFAVDGLPIDVSASIGIALQSERGGDGATLLRQAEAAMYDAKQRAFGPVVIGWSATLHVGRLTPVSPASFASLAISAGVMSGRR